MKPLIVLILVMIIASLGKALFSMSSGPQHGAQVLAALSWRIGLSVALFLLLFAGYYFGWIEPHHVR